MIKSVFLTAKHYNPGLKLDAASVWIEDVTQSSCKVCLRELQNYAGSHQDVVVVSNGLTCKINFLNTISSFLFSNFVLFQLTFLDSV